MKRALLALALLTMVQPLDGKGKPPPPPPPPGASNPEIAYIRITGGSRRFYEFVMSNEDGTGATTVYSSRDVGQMMVHLGPRADKTFVLVQGGKLSFGRYELTATGPHMTSLNEIANMNHVGAATVDFSRNGEDVVYMRNATAQVWRYHIPTNTHTMLVDLAGIGGGISISYDGLTVYYLEEVGPESYALKSVPMAGGTPTELGPRGFYTGTDAANSKDELLITDIADHPVYRLRRYDIASGSLTYVTNGYEASYKCDDSRIAYALSAGGSMSILYRDEPSGQQATLSTKELYWPEYFPTC